MEFTRKTMNIDEITEQRDLSWGSTGQMLTDLKMKRITNSLPRLLTDVSKSKLNLTEQMNVGTYYSCGLNKHT